MNFKQKILTLIYSADFFFFMYVIQHCFICHPSDSTVSEEAGIDPRTACYDFGIDSQTL